MFNFDSLGGGGMPFSLPGYGGGACDILLLC